MKMTDKLLDDVYHYRRSVVVLTAVYTGLFDYLMENSASSVAEIANRFHWTDRAAKILLNALCALGYLKMENNRYSIATVYRQAFNCENYPLVKHWMIHEWRLLNRWTHLPAVLESGEPYREPEKTTDHRNHCNFMLAMAQREKENLPVMLDAVSLNGYSHLLDLGGGPGLFSIALAEKYPGLQATVFDTPHTEPIAREFFEKSSARNRLRFRPGDFLTDGLGSGYDAVLLSSILHIYGPEQNQELLQKVYNAMEPGGKILIRDFLLNRKKTGPLIGALFAINMLVNTQQGNSYSTEELKKWLREAGFKNIGKKKLQRRMALLVAVK